MKWLIPVAIIAMFATPAIAQEPTAGELIAESKARYAAALEANAAIIAAEEADGVVVCYEDGSCAPFSATREALGAANYAEEHALMPRYWREVGREDLAAFVEAEE